MKEIWENIKGYEELTNKSDISRCINNKRKTANNFIWVCESVVMSNV